VRLQVLFEGLPAFFISDCDGGFDGPRREFGGTADGFGVMIAQAFAEIFR
jgi:hypothetical protein